MQAFQNMNPVETVFFVLLVYSPYYLPVILILWIVLILTLFILKKRGAAKRTGIALSVTVSVILLLWLITKGYI